MLHFIVLIILFIVVGGLLGDSDCGKLSSTANAIGIIFGLIVGCAFLLNEGIHGNSIGWYMGLPLAALLIWIFNENYKTYKKDKEEKELQNNKEYLTQNQKTYQPPLTDEEIKILQGAKHSAIQETVNTEEQQQKDINQPLSSNINNTKLLKRIKYIPINISNINPANDVKFESFNNILNQVYSVSIEIKEKEDVVLLPRHARRERITAEKYYPDPINTAHPVPLTVNLRGIMTISIEERMKRLSVSSLQELYCRYPQFISPFELPTLVSAGLIRTQSDIIYKDGNYIDNENSEEWEDFEYEFDRDHLL